MRGDTLTHPRGGLCTDVGMARGCEACIGSRLNTWRERQGVLPAGHLAWGLRGQPSRRRRQKRGLLITAEFISVLGALPLPGSGIRYASYSLTSR